ncbi:MAG: NADH-quinone oxidoreductase subunit N [Opitutaceae bacterium]
MNTNYTELFFALRPEAFLVAGALAVLGLDLSIGRRLDDAQRLTQALAVGAFSVLCACALAWAGPRGAVFGGAFMFDRFAVATRLGVLALTLLVLGVASAARSPRNSAEFVAVILFAATGFTLMAAVQQLLLSFLALELASLSLYVLAGFDKGRPESSEAGLKYFLFGGMAAAFLLFGFSLVYGIAGSIDLPEIGTRISMLPHSPLLAVALAMILVALGFKLAAAPFHLWAPDVYEGAPTASAALVASASKLAGITFFTRLLWVGFGGAAGDVSSLSAASGWLPGLAAIAALSMLIGNFGALAQQSIRRLLAYSAIAHSGALLLGVMAAARVGAAPVFYYAATYGIATVGAFGVIAVAERSGPCQRISDLAGLYRRSPLLGGCLAVFILSLAGIPPLAGFYGKFAVFAAALQLGGLAGPAGWLAVMAIGLSALALYYYLIVLKQALVTAPAGDAKPIAVPVAAGVTLVAAAALILLFGVRPSLLLDLF